MRRANVNVVVVAVGAVVLAAATLAYIGTAAAPAQAESNGGVRVMPLGDSITDGFNVPGGYRIGLWQRFGPAGFSVDFVGSASNGPATLGDHDHEGHSGWRIDQLDANIVGWLQATTPHTVLLHIGTNDVIQNTDLPNAPSRLSGLIDKITNTVPTAEVFVATIIPLGSSSQEAAVRTYNAAVPGLVQSKANAGRHVHLVDMHSALTTADLADGIHPNAGGYDKMAAAWFAALRSVPGSLGPTTSPTSPPTSPPTTPPTSPPTTPPGGGKTCTAAYSVTNQWSGGFQAGVQITAGSSAISSWTVTWTFANGQTVAQFWDSAITSNGPALTARNLSYNGGLSAGGRAQFGFIGNWTATNSAPAAACTAG
jgi:lysophospholipase L1-like esterase